MTEQHQHDMRTQDTSTNLLQNQFTEKMQQFQPKVAGFWVRFWAYLIDLIVLSSISGLIIKPIFRVLSIPVTNPVFLFFTPYKVTLLIMTLLYFLFMTKFLQQTVGKMILGIKVVGKGNEKVTWGTLVFREVIGRFISKLLVFPYVLVAFMPKKEALHDLFADTYVVHENIYEKNHSSDYLHNHKGEQLQEQAHV